jgi:CubicO group peptidase (beta-lactamase class C family)
MSNVDENKWNRLGEVVNQSMEGTGVPGVAVGILHEGETVTAGFGVTSVENPLPVTGETLFQIGSISKTFTGTAIMQLVEQGQLDLDATVRTYVPDFAVSDGTASAQATIRHLLTHTGGWAGDFFHATGTGDDALARYVADMAELPQLVPIGSLWSYNNAGFSLAGYIIERVVGQSYEAALKELVLEPLGLQASFFDPGEVMTHRFAVGHNVVEGTARVARPWPLERSTHPAGGITSTVRDLLRYARFHLEDGRADDGSPLLSPDSIAQMQSPQVTLWEDEAWGLTWAVNQVDGKREISHGGGTNGQISQLALVPEHGFALAVLTNADRGSELTRAVRRWALKEYLDLEATKPQPIESSEEELAQYVGCYRGYFADLELGLLGGKLVAQTTYKRSFPSEHVPPPPAPPPMSLARCEPDRLLVIDGRFKDTLVDVIRNPDGSIGWLRAGGRLRARES